VGNVRFTNAATALPTKTYGTLTLGAGGNALDSLTVDTLNITSGTLAMGSSDLTVNTLLNNFGLVTVGTGTVTIPNAASGNFRFTENNNIPEATYSDLTLDNALATFTASGKVIADNLAIDNGIFDLAGSNMDINTSFTNNGTLKLVGSEVLGGSFSNDDTSGIVDYYGGGIYPELAAGASYFDLVVSGIGSFSNTANITVNNNFTQNSGTFTAPVGNIRVAGDFLITGGTFNHNNGTIIFNGAAHQDITSAGTTYNRIEILNASPLSVEFKDGFIAAELEDLTAGSHLIFAAGETYTVTTLVTITGDAVNLIELSSATPGAQWNFMPPVDPLNTQISFIRVSDSINQQTYAINPLNSIDGGNNINWFASNPPKPPDPPIDDPVIEQAVVEADLLVALNYDEEEKKYKKPTYKYRTIVIVFEGTVIVAPYDARGTKYDEAIVVNAKQRFVIEKEID
jgi:hypothetical protein